MKTYYYLLMLFPAGIWNSGNKVIAEAGFDNTKRNTKNLAIGWFQTKFPELKLDADGYAKHGTLTYCVAEGLTH